MCFRFGCRGKRWRRINGGHSRKERTCARKWHGLLSAVYDVAVAGERPFCGCGRWLSSSSRLVMTAEEEERLVVLGGASL